MNNLKARRPLLVGVGVGVLAVLVFVVLVMPKMSDVKKQQKALDAAVKTGQQLTAQVGELEDAKHQAASVRKQLAKLELAIPSVTALPRLIRQVQHVADVAAVDFVQVSPGAPTATTGSYSTVPTQITATGSYFAVTEFLYELETLPRDVKVTSITVGPGPTGLPQLALNLSAEVYTTDTSAGPGSTPGPSKSTSSTGSSTGGA
jgi:Tfp pilus assembly protein PilO